MTRLPKFLASLAVVAVGSLALVAASPVPAECSPDDITCATWTAYYSDATKTTQVGYRAWTKRAGDPECDCTPYNHWGVTSAYYTTGSFNGCP